MSEQDPAAPPPYPHPYGGPPLPPSYPGAQQVGYRPVPSSVDVGPPEGPGREPRGRTSPWIWPAVCALALVLGVVGGIVGAAAYDRGQEPAIGPVVDGLDGVDLATRAPLTPPNGTVAKVAKTLLPSTVQIIAEYQGQDDGATGSGFVLDAQGHVVTNNHVVAAAAKDDGPIQVVDQDGTRYDATIVGRSTVYDLAVLSVPKAKGLRPAALGASRSLVVGQTVVAFGSPLGLSSTVTAGIVSALQRPVTTGRTDDQSSYINAVQTDAAINPGNSGGPLVDLLGRVVGVNSAIATTGGGASTESGSIGVGFAIPVEQVRITADQILRTGRAQFPVIGAQVRTGRDDGQGAVLGEIIDGGAAAAADLRSGDRITAVDDQRVTDGIGLIVAIRTHQPGEQVRLRVTRDGETREIAVRLRAEVG